MIDRHRQAVRRHFDLTYEPGTGRITEAKDAQISPSGRAVAFTATQCDVIEVGTYSRIALASGGEVRLLTAGPNDDHSPRWSPDGAKIGFLSDRASDGLAALHLFDVGSSEVVGTPAIDGIVESFAWAPDGRSILLCVAGVDADRGDVSGPGRRRPARQAGEQVRVAPDWRPTSRDQPTDDRTRSIWILDLAAGSVRLLTTPAITVWEAAWCGSSAIVAVTSSGWSEGAWFASVLTRIDVEDGAFEVLYRPPFQIGRPVGSPSGSAVAVISGLCSDRGIVPGDLVVIDLDGRGPRVLGTGGTDVTDITWLDDARVAFIGVRDLDTVAGVVHATEDDGRVTDTWVSRSSCGRHIPHASFAPSGAMAVVNDSYTDFPSVTTVTAGQVDVAWSLAPAGVANLQADAGTVEAVSWQAPDGETIRGWLCRPRGSGPFPLVLHVHGGPVGATTNAWLMGNDTTRLLVADGFAVLHPNPRGSLGRGQGFVEAVRGDMGGADAEDLLAGVEAMVARGIADPTKLAVVGTSYGGFMASLLPTRDNRFAAAVSMSPVTDWESFGFTSNIPEFASLFLGAGDGPDRTAAIRRQSPLAHAGHSNTPTLQVAGARDRCTPADQAIRYFDVLAARGIPARLVLYPQAGHGVQHLPALMDLCCQVLDWLGAQITSEQPT